MASFPPAVTSAIHVFTVRMSLHPTSGLCVPEGQSLLVRLRRTAPGKDGVLG